MRNILAFILFYLYYPSIKRLTRKNDALLSIYGHNPKGKSIEKTIKFLIKHGYDFITPAEVMTFLDGKLKKGKPVWLSFDDGRKNIYHELLPLLEKYKIPATIFIATKGINDGYFWTDKALENRKSKLYTKIDELWQMHNEKRKIIINMLPAYKGKRTAMSRKELLELSKSEYVFLANHTHDHVICDTCTSDELKAEIKMCEEQIKIITGKPCIKAFAYPNGNYDSKTIVLLKETGYKLAASTSLDWVYNSTDPYLIPRFVLPDDASFFESILQIYGLWTPFFDKIKKILGIKNHK